MDLYKKEEYYTIIGLCMEIHRILGGGLSEAIYKDALEIELTAKEIPYEREKPYRVNYKGVVLAHFYYADFVIYGEIILEVKAIRNVLNEHLSQIINYMKLADSQIGIIANFNIKSLEHKRIIL